MQKKTLAFLAPPFAIARFGGRVAWCAAPIGTVWMSAIVGILIGIQGDMSTATREPMLWVIALGLAIWAVSSVWALMVIGGVDHDAAHDADSTLEHTVHAEEDELDPLEQIRGMR